MERSFAAIHGSRKSHIETAGSPEPLTFDVAVGNPESCPRPISSDVTGVARKRSSKVGVPRAFTKVMPALERIAGRPTSRDVHCVLDQEKGQPDLGQSRSILPPK